MGAREPGTIAIDLTCAECGRSPQPGVTYCPDCAEREFGADSDLGRDGGEKNE